MLQIRTVERRDLIPLLELYTQLHGNPVPKLDRPLETLWDGILADSNHHIIVGELSGRLVSSCALLIVPNLTHGQRPYALLENVVTHSAHRRRGFAASLLEFAKEIAKAQNCYKIMLMTGAKDTATLHFYKRAGFNSHDKTAFVAWI